MNKNTWNLASFAGVSLLFLSSCTIGGVEIPSGSSSDTVLPVSAGSVQGRDDATIASTVNSTIKKSATYAVPGQSITTEFTIGLAADGSITSVNASTDSRDRHDQQYHSRFNRSATSLVGKKISDIKNLSTIGGASLTTDAFLEAIISL